MQRLDGERGGELYGLRLGSGDRRERLQLDRARRGDGGRLGRGGGKGELLGGDLLELKGKGR